MGGEELSLTVPPRVHVVRATISIYYNSDANHASTEFQCSLWSGEHTSG